MIRRVPNLKLDAVMFVAAQPTGEAQRWQVAKYLNLDQQQAAMLIRDLIGEGQLQLTSMNTVRVHPESPAAPESAPIESAIAIKLAGYCRITAEQLVDSKPDDPTVDELLIGAAFLLERAARHLEGQP